jgi:carbonic anhydrase
VDAAGSELGVAEPGFDDLLAANRLYSQSFDLSGSNAQAKAGVAMVTCMDARIDPLRLVGLRAGDAKILRNPGGRLTSSTLCGLLLAVNLLGVTRIMIVQHTRCAMASATETELRARLTTASGMDASWVSLGAIGDQQATLRDDVVRVRTHPLVPANVTVGGFMYDVDTGLLQQLA